MKVLIGIQARSTSTRLPRKATEMICGFSILDRVISACTGAANVIQRKSGSPCDVAVLTPDGDPIATDFRDKAAIVEGSEHDVLGRYMVALDRFEPELLVRITGDCPLIPSGTIVSLVLLAINHRYDYISNADDRFRTSADGTDCEVISTRLMRHIGATATEAYDREHVTPMIRRMPTTSQWNIGTAVGHFDYSHIKLSIDTPEDLEHVRRAFESSFSKYQSAIRTLGKRRVHRI